MKTLKKTLCLVLALVMAFSLMSVASAANLSDYTDADKVGAAYEEAVDVLLGLGIVNGISDTEIAPEGYYTRAQAAKIATYLAVGGSVAEMLPAGESFSDVPATHWAAKYISYCAEKGILNGVTATEYQPEEKVTGYQFAKMILAAAGYGANNEFVGSGWAIATAGWALDKNINLFKGDSTAATNEPITRQQAMLIAFNALQRVEYVGYDKDTGLYIAADGVDRFDYNNTFGDKNYSLTLDTGVDTDDYGRPVNTWKATIGGTTKTIASVAATPVATYTTAVSAATLYNTLGFDAVIDASASAYTAMDITNGQYLTTSGAASSDYAVADKDTAIGGNGIITEIYDVDDTTTTTKVEYAVVQMQPTLFKLGAPSKAAASSTEGAHTDWTVGSVTLKDYTSVVNAKLDIDTFTTDSALAKDDYVLVYGNDDAGYTVKHATQVSGKMTAYNSATGVRTIAGASYSASAAAANTGVLTTAIGSYATYNTTATFIVDTYGYVMGTITVNVPDNYIYVVKGGYAVTTLNGTTLSTVINAKGVTTDGEIAEFTAASVNTVPVVGATDVATGLYTYTVNTNGTYALTTVTQDVGSSLAYTSPAVASGVYGNASTTYYIVKWTAGTAADHDRVVGTTYYKLNGVTAVTGYANIGSLSNVTGEYIDANSDGIAEIVFIGTNGVAGASASYIYYLGTYNYDGTTYTYDVIKDGVVTTMTSSDITSGLSGAGLYTLSTGTASAISTSSAYNATTKAGLYCTDGVTYTLENKGGLLYFYHSNDTTPAYLDTIGDAVPVYTVTAATGVVAVGTAADLATATSGAQIAIVPNAAANAIAAIWIVK